MCTYIENSLDDEQQNRLKLIRLVYNTHHETFPLHCFDNYARTIRFLLCQDQSIELRFFLYIYPDSFK